VPINLRERRVLWKVEVGFAEIFGRRFEKFGGRFRRFVGRFGEV
jgi:hypothetical protein